MTGGSNGLTRGSMQETSVTTDSICGVIASLEPAMAYVSGCPVGLGVYGLSPIQPVGYAYGSCVSMRLLLSLRACAMKRCRSVRVALTGLANRRMYGKTMEGEWAR